MQMYGQDVIASVQSEQAGSSIPYDFSHNPDSPAEATNIPPTTNFFWFFYSLFLFLLISFDLIVFVGIISLVILPLLLIPELIRMRRPYHILKSLVNGHNQ